MSPLSGNSYKVIGVMSGTSCDGLDLAACEFIFAKSRWNFSVIAAETVPYDESWLRKLKNAPFLSGNDLIYLHGEYGIYTGEKINEFIAKTGFIPEMIASHGHTVFHRPDEGFTFQLGNGANIAAVTGIPTVADFRNADVALGGQGAPLVPVGDRLLFPEYDYCLNLGGFANISFESNLKRIAFDICPVNAVLNHLSQNLGFEFDQNGDLGRRGTIDAGLLNELNQISFYREKPPKSLGREWLEEVFLPVLEKASISIEDKLRTVYEHISMQIAAVVKRSGRMLVTGGGAFNLFLAERVAEKIPCQMVIPPAELVNFKEALIFALLGVLKTEGKINCLSSVTGAVKDHCCGVVFYP